MAFITSLVIFQSIREFNDIIMPLPKARDYVFAALGAILPFLFLFYGIEAALPYLTAMVFIFFLSRMFAGRALPAIEEFPASVKRLTTGIFSIAYLAATLSHIVLLSGLERGRLWLLFLLTIVWANDTFAYYTGRTIGSRKLSPMISPNKTIEGAIGGIIGGVILGYLFGFFLKMPFNLIEVIIVSISIGVAAIIGDLSESLVKRAGGVKDSGTVIPGHGGMLDRIDSIIFSIPFLYYYLLWR